MRNVTAAVLIIGNEVLSGRTEEANLHYLARALSQRNIVVGEARIVGDRVDDIVDAVNHLRRRYDYLFTTGGIGATHDDITAASVAKATKRKMVRHAGAVQLIMAHYGGEPGDVRLRMADMPDGAELIPNAVSAAPGFRIENIYVLAGVPAIARAMFDAIAGQLQGGAPIFSQTINAYIGENAIADEMAVIAGRNPDVDIGSYPHFRMGRLGTALVVRGTDNDKVLAVADELRSLINKMGDYLLVAE